MSGAWQGWSPRINRERWVETTHGTGSKTNSSTATAVKYQERDCEITATCIGRFNHGIDVLGA